MSNLSIETCIKALTRAAISRRAAFQTEIGVGFAVFLIKGNAEKEARQLLTETYASAGYMCLTPTDPDYKTINRRINATADLFNTIKLRTVKKWAGTLDENNLIAAMVEGLKPYDLQSISDMQRYCTPPATVTTSTAPVTEVAPHTGILGTYATTGQDKVLTMFRRVADREADAAHRITTEHLALIVTKDTSPGELVELARKALDLAKELTAQLEKETA